MTKVTGMTKMTGNEIKENVREHYAKVARDGGGCNTFSSQDATACCSSKPPAAELSRMVGYKNQDLAEVPSESNLGLGCGNPVALASLHPGEVVVDLGSGAGFDSFLAANRVGPLGLVVGVDMTSDMIEKARQNARTGGYSNVKFRQGEIESLPLANDFADVVISNCVINLSPDKSKAFREAFRILKPGGRLMVSDLVLEKELPETVRNSVEAYAGCIAGAMLRDDYLAEIWAAGFGDVQVMKETTYPGANAVASLQIQAAKP